MKKIIKFLLFSTLIILVGCRQHYKIYESDLDNVYEQIDDVKEFIEELERKGNVNENDLKTIKDKVNDIENLLDESILEVAY